MFWRFGFSSASTLDSLLERPNVTLEEVLDEEDLLQECKNQNAKLVSFLTQPRVLGRLLEHVVGTAEVGGGSGRDWEEKVRFKYPYLASEVLCSDVWAVVETVLEHKEELLEPFWNTILTARPQPNQPAVPQHMHPLFADPADSAKLGVANAAGASAAAETTQESAESDGMESADAGVLGLDTSSGQSEGHSFTTARENGPGRSVLAGYWAKVNGVFLDKKPLQMLDFVRGLPCITERFVAHLETPAVVDLLYRIVQCDESVPAAGVIEWLSERQLIPKLVELLAPCYSADLHNTTSELLKAIIALSAPATATLNQAPQSDAYGGYSGEGQQQQQQLSCMNNRLVRELASEAMVRKMVGFMLDDSLPSQLHRRLSVAADEQLAAQDAKAATSKPATAGKSQTLNSLSEAENGAAGSESALDDEEADAAELKRKGARTPLTPADHPAIGAGPGRHDSTSTLRPSTFPPVSAPTVPVTSDTCTSSLVTCIGVFIELIRKNNSDYFEQHLFHTLRTHLLQRQQEIAEARAQKRAAEAADTSSSTATPDGDQSWQQGEDEDMEGMEEAMAELSDKLGIVQLGPLLRVLCERLSDFQELVQRPRASAAPLSTTLGPISALTFERYRITELYAELLHCSNMALLNRAPGEGPVYSEDGVLTGGIEGLQILARMLHGGDAGSETAGDTTRGTLNASAPGSTSGAADESMDVSAGSADAVESAAGENGANTPASLSVGNSAPSSRAHSREATRHRREESSTTDGSSNSEDADAADEKDPFADEDGEAASSDAAPASTDQSASSTDTVVDAPAAAEPLITEAQSAAHAAEVAAPVPEADADEAQTIRSALSGLSLAELTSPAPSGPPSPIDDARQYVVGDLLKKRFLESGIIPTILTLFFEYPWNNFLHNVVYDILQQFFNGRMDTGLNRRLAIAVFESGKLTDRIVAGHRANEASLEGPRRIRLGYMGHMNLIAEETVKLLERYPQEVAAVVADSITQPDWDNFVNETLREAREREAAPLAGGRPAAGRALNFASQGDGDVASSSDDNDQFANYLSSQMGAGGVAGSDDDDSDEDASYLSQDIQGSARSQANGAGGGFDDAFEPPRGSGGVGSSGSQDDDDWGPFSDSGGGDFDFAAEASSSASAYTQQPNLTPADWAADFDRTAREQHQQASSEGEGSDAGDSASEEASSSSSDAGGRTPTAETAPSGGLGGILDSAPSTSDVVASAHARRPSLGQSEAPASSVRRRASSGAGSAEARQALRDEEPLGPGVSADVRRSEESGMLERNVDGQTITVPLDEVALSSAAESAENESAVVD